MSKRQTYRTGILILTAFLSIAIGCLACGKMDNTAATSPADTSVPVTGALKMLALGDSYTIGESVQESERFPNQAIAMLRSKGLDFSYPSTVVATTGWTTQNLLDGIAASDVAKKAPYDVVTLLIGVNNQYQGRDLDEYRTQFTECLDKAILFSGNKKEHVFVVSIPDWGVTPFAEGRDRAQIATAIDQFNAINKQITESRGIAYIDITPISRRSDASLVAGDGLHPSGKQYTLWEEALIPVILSRKF